MSHVAAIDLHVTDLDSLGKSAKAHGGELILNQETFNWYGTWQNDYDANNAAYRQGIDPSTYGRCTHAIKFNGIKYEIGVVKHPTKPGYTLVYDFFGYDESSQHDGHKLVKLLGGNDAPLLKQEYAAQVAVKHLSKVAPGQRPWQVTRTKLATGGIQIRATR
jgi:hypothetical protein